MGNYSPLTDATNAEFREKQNKTVKQYFQEYAPIQSQEFYILYLEWNDPLGLFVLIMSLQCKCDNIKNRLLYELERDTYTLPVAKAFSCQQHAT